MANHEPPPGGSFWWYIGWAIAYLGTETVRIWTAGGMGGLVRWLVIPNGRKGLQSLTVQVLIGMTCAAYLWPIGLRVPKLIGLGDFESTTTHATMSAFVIGTAAASIIRLISKLIDRVTSNKD